MKNLHIDIETYSSADLMNQGVSKYVESPDFEILLFAYSIDGESARLIDLAQGESLPAEIITALNDKNIIKHAFNAAFEITCLKKFFKTEPEQWRCSQVHALYCGYPSSLKGVSEAMELSEDTAKLATGRSLINYFCKPCKPTKTNDMRTRNLPKHDFEKWELFKQYCKQDVVAEMEVEKRLSNFPVTPRERRLWVLDYKINSTGIAVDKELVEGAIYCDSVIKNELMEEAILISGISNPNSTAQLKEWLENETGEEVKSVAKSNVSALLKTGIGDKAKRILSIRGELAKTSTAKYQAIADRVLQNGTVANLFQFYGANRSGRWAGRGVQVQNLPRNYSQALDCARDLVKGKKITALKLIFGNVPNILSELIRTVFIPEPKQFNSKLVVADFSAIEARVLAWLAAEQWRIDVFATHGKIYEASAAQMFDVPIEKIVKGNPEYELRQKGKIAELALGYGGSTEALRAMGADKMGLDDWEMKKIVMAWRKANPAIEQFWESVNTAAIQAVEKGSKVILPVSPSGKVHLIFRLEADCWQKYLTVELPSGRKLFYVNPSISKNRFGGKCISYWESHNKKWMTADTYGGKLVENITQAVARDCLAELMYKVYKYSGYYPVMHIHDEVVYSVQTMLDSAEKRLDFILELMKESIEWAQGLLLGGDGFITNYYKKDG